MRRKKLRIHIIDQLQKTRFVAAASANALDLKLDGLPALDASQLNAVSFLLEFSLSSLSYQASLKSSISFLVIPFTGGLSLLPYFSLFQLLLDAASSSISSIEIATQPEEE